MTEFILLLLLSVVVIVILVNGKGLLEEYRMGQLVLRLVFGPVLLHVFIKEIDVYARVNERYPRARYTDEEVGGVLRSMEAAGWAERQNEYVNISREIDAMVRDAQDDTTNKPGVDGGPSEDLKNIIKDLEEISEMAKDLDPLKFPLWRKKPMGKRSRPPSNTAGAEASTQHIHTSQVCSKYEA